MHLRSRSGLLDRVATLQVIQNLLQNAGLETAIANPDR
jgi:hypothetical protein